MSDRSIPDDLLLAELRLALLRAKNTVSEVEYVGKLYKEGIITAPEVLESLEHLGWAGILNPVIMGKIRKGQGFDVG